MKRELIGKTRRTGVRSKGIIYKRKNIIQMRKQININKKPESAFMHDFCRNTVRMCGTVPRMSFSDISDQLFITVDRRVYSIRCYVSEAIKR